MKFWITCKEDASKYRSHTVHASKPEWQETSAGGYWWSTRRFHVCDLALLFWFGEDYDLPKPGECWEFTTEETIWIHTE